MSHTAAPTQPPWAKDIVDVLYNSEDDEKKDAIALKTARVGEHLATRAMSSQLRLELPTSCLQNFRDRAHYEHKSRRRVRTRFVEGRQEVSEYCKSYTYRTPHAILGQPYERTLCSHCPRIRAVATPNLYIRGAAANLRISVRSN